jgi:predicted RNA-binding protein with PUA-like domain
MATYLLKTEPSEYSFADLQRDKKTLWSGVSNPAACAALRAMTKGDDAVIYHTGDEKSIVGLARVTKAAVHDPDQPEALTGAGEIKHPVIEIQAVKAAKKLVTLAEIKSDARFKDFALVKQSRLSVMLVPPALDKVLRGLTGLAS